MKLGKSTKRYREGSGTVLSIPAISINEGFKEAPPSQGERQHWARAGRSTSESQCWTMYLEKLTRQYCNFHGINSKISKIIHPSLSPYRSHPGAYKEAIDVWLRDQFLAVLWGDAATILDTDLAVQMSVVEKDWIDREHDYACSVNAKSSEHRHTNVDRCPVPYS